MAASTRSRTVGARRAAAVLLPWLSGVVGGCVVGPDFDQPAPPAVESLVTGTLKSPGSAGGERQEFFVGSDIPGEWWQLFRSEQLNALIEGALQENYDLKAAEAALRVAQANTQAGRGILFPQVSTNFSATRQKVSEDPLLPSTPTGTPYYTTYTDQLNIGYVPDVFGGTRRQIEALNANAEVQRFQLEAVQLSLTSNLALAAVQEAALRAQIRATRKVIAIVQEILALQRKQFALGQIDGVDVAGQEAALAQLELNLPPLEKQLAQQRTQMIALAGHFPGEGLPLRFELSDFQLPDQLPVSLPFELVRQRPDVRAAEANMHAACALVGVAIANRLPQFNILANGGTTSSLLAHVLDFSTKYSFWTVAGSVGQVLFDGFTLEQRQRAAEAGLDQAAAQYKSTVVVGYQNVANALEALDYDARAVRAAVKGERAASQSLHLVRERLRLGKISGIEILNAQQTFHLATLAVVQAKAVRYADTIALFQALGGGWRNRSDVPAELSLRGWWSYLIRREGAEEVPVAASSWVPR